MKYHLLLACVTCFFQVFSQPGPALPKEYKSVYEQQVLLDKNATLLELLMVQGGDPSAERTSAAKKELDAFVAEVKSSSIMRFPEAKLMKELHEKVRERFFTHYQSISPFYLVFETGKYNCVSATALFALVLEELGIPYNIQEQPGHVYIMAYPDTKGVSVEMTAAKDASYMPPRKDVSRAIRTLLEFELTTEDEIKKLGAMNVYNKHYNTNSAINLKELAGIQYFNEAITATNEDRFEEALNAICKTEKLYNVEKTQLYKSELLVTLIADAKFDSMKDIAYLVGYANLEKSDHDKVYYQYISFLHKQLITKGNRELADSSNTYVVSTVSDSALTAKLSGVYYMALSEYFANSYNLKKQLEYAETAYKTSPDNPELELWLARSIAVAYMDKFQGEELATKMDTYVVQYPFLEKHNLFLMTYFYAYTTASNEYYRANDGANGKKYFDLALKSRLSMSDQEVLDEEYIGWLYAEAGAYLYRENDYKAALKLLEEGLELAPGHERLLARIEIVKSKIK